MQPLFRDSELLEHFRVILELELVSRQELLRQFPASSAWVDLE
jgi:hypothetical protein